MQHTFNGNPFTKPKAIPFAQTNGRTANDINRRSAGMRTCLKRQVFNCVRQQTLNGT